MSNPVGWFEIYVKDMQRAKAFYEQVFQVTLTALAGDMQESLEMYTFAMDDHGYGATGALVKMDGVLTGFAGTLVYFSCEDCAVEAKRAAQAGGTIFKDKFSIGEHGHIAMVYDTEGNMIGLHSIQ
ncbi:VOC family protein [Thiolinea disciformis]|uniref:VOC family protein n=1 Tax=Thiolinea disciformis TaxID=125614 RepID=UPI00036CCCAC|nr:VOC family protein [Thiolinea disciformis]